MIEIRRKLHLTACVYSLCLCFTLCLSSIGFEWEGYDIPPPSTTTAEFTSAPLLSNKEFVCYRRSGHFVCPDCAQKFKSVSGIKYHLENAVCRGAGEGEDHGNTQEDYNERKWNQHFEEVCEYISKHGNSDGGTGDHPLCKWCKRQRYKCRQWINGMACKGFTFERKRKLDSVGFDWKGYDLPLSRTGNADASAGSTLRRMSRSKILKSKAPSGIQEETNADKYWNAMFRELYKYKDKRGHLDGIHSVDESLGRFAYRQRYELRAMLAKEHSTFTVEKKALLDKIGFDWKGYDIPPESVSEKESGEDLDDSVQSEEEETSQGDGPLTTASRDEMHCCPNCDREFRSKGGLNYHIDNSVCGVIACSKCYKLFKSENGLKYHCANAICDRTHYDDADTTKVEKKREPTRQIDTNKEKESAASAKKEAVGAENYFPPSWEDLFEDLKSFKAENGHFEAPSDESAYDELHAFVQAQREGYQRRRKSALQIEHEDLLNKVGFIWTQPALPPVTPTPAQPSRRLARSRASTGKRSGKAVMEDVVCPDCTGTFASKSSFAYHVRNGVCKSKKANPPPPPAKGPCCVAGCQKPSEGRRNDYMCASHYAEVVKGPVKRGTTTRFCSVEGSRKSSQGRRTDYMCLSHYNSSRPPHPSKRNRNKSAGKKRKLASNESNRNNSDNNDSSIKKHKISVGRSNSRPIDPEWVAMLDKLVAYQKIHGRNAKISSRKRDLHDWYEEQKKQYELKKKRLCSSLSKKQMTMLEEHAGFSLS